MAEDDHETHADHEHDPEGDHEHHQSEYATERITAPQSEYTNRDVAVGFVVALVGMAVVFGVPLLLA
jgi:hypothetical protein